MAVEPDEGNRLHRTLRELKEPRRAEDLCTVALEVVPDCVGAAFVDLATDADHALMAMATPDAHPADIMGMLPAAIHDLLAGPSTTRVIDAWEQLHGRRSELDNLRFTTGPLAHYAARLNSDPTILFTTVVPVDTNPRIVLLNVGRIVELAWVDRG